LYKERLQQHPNEEYLKNKLILYDTVYSSIIFREESIVEDEQSERNQRRLGRGYPIKLISYLKCHYSMLDFHDVIERKEHELEWYV